jgi:hypothetical protein
MDLEDFHILDLETFLWLPCNYCDPLLSGGCVGQVFHEGNSDPFLPDKGWIFSGEENMFVFFRLLC